MVNYHENFRQLLIDAVEGNVAVYYEKFEDKTLVPCISYMEASNTSTAVGDTLQFSEVVFQVKIWAETVSELVEVSNQIDRKLQKCGFRRTSAFEMIDDEYFVKVFRYRAISYEKEL